MQKWLLRMLGLQSHSRFESLNLKAWWAVIWWLSDVWKQSICISSRAVGKSQRCLLASPNCVYGDAFVVERQQPKQMRMKSSFHAYIHSFWWQKLLHHMFLKKSCIWILRVLLSSHLLQWEECDLCDYLCSHPQCQQLRMFFFNDIYSQG